MAFYGGFGDLLATEAMERWVAADEICIAVAIDSWQPTRGTRLTGQRNAGQHFIFFEQSVGACRYATGAHLEFAGAFRPLKRFRVSR